MLTVLVFWLIFAIVVGIIAGSRGRSAIGWVLLALLISPLIACLLVLALPTRSAFALNQKALAHTGRAGGHAHFVLSLFERKQSFALIAGHS